MSYYISVKEAADYLGADVSLVRAMIKKGWLPGEKVDRAWRVPADAVEYFYASIAPRIDWTGDSHGELVLAHNHRCPVCAGSFQPSPRGKSGFGDEFLECLDCGLSVHESLLQHEAVLSQHVGDHGTALQKKESEGMKARALLLRRQSALRKVYQLLEKDAPQPPANVTDIPPPGAERGEHNDPPDPAIPDASPLPEPDPDPAP
jgi:excisionase family DNA binding protein